MIVLGDLRKMNEGVARCKAIQAQHALTKVALSERNASAIAAVSKAIKDGLDTFMVCIGL